MTGTWLLPSLNRAKLLKEFFESYIKAKSTTPITALVDRQDPQMAEYLKVELPDKCKLFITESVLMADKVHEYWRQHKDLDWIGILNDDHRLVTEEWDKKIMAQLNGSNVVFTNDGGWNFPHRICGAICFSGKILRALDYVFPGGIKHLYSDDAWGFLFSRAQCAQGLGDVTVLHDHAYKKKELQDETFFKINGPGGLKDGVGTGGLWPADRAAFDKWFKEDAEKDVQKIIDIQPKTGMMVATPSQDGNCSLFYALGLAETSTFLTSNGIYYELARVTGSSLLPHARNSLVDMFLKSRCKKLLFIDADQGFDKDSVLRLFQSERKIIAAVTPHKRFPINLNFEPLDEDKHHFQSLANKSQEEFYAFAKNKAMPNGDIKVKHAGTGMILIDRSVFEEILEFFRKEEGRIQDFKKRIETLMPDLAIEYADIITGYLNHKFGYQAFDDRPEVTHQEYYKMGGNEGRFRGEDWLFCQIADRLKIPTYINAYATIAHSGSYTWGIDRPNFPMGQPRKWAAA